MNRTIAIYLIVCIASLGPLLTGIRGRHDGGGVPEAPHGLTRKM